MQKAQPTITVHAIVNAPIAYCWKVWTTPADILQFNNPFDDWHTARVEIDLKVDGRLYYRMEAINGSAGFDFSGKYDRIIINELIEYTGDDGRKSVNTFTSEGDVTTITEVFEPEPATSVEIQTTFVQTILDNFKKYIESTNISD